MRLKLDQSDHHGQHRQGRQVVLEFVAGPQPAERQDDVALRLRRHRGHQGAAVEVAGRPLEVGRVVVGQVHRVVDGLHDVVAVGDAVTGVVVVLEHLHELAQLRTEDGLDVGDVDEDRVVSARGGAAELLEHAQVVEVADVSLVEHDLERRGLGVGAVDGDDTEPRNLESLHVGHVWASQ